MRNRFSRSNCSTLLLVGLCLALATLTTACPQSSGNLVQQTAVASRDASVAVLAFQKWEIQAHDAQAIPDSDHQVIQSVMLKIGIIGKTLDARLRTVTTNADALTVIDGALTDVTQLINNDVIHVNSAAAHSYLLLTLTTVQVSLQSIHTMLLPKDQVGSQPAPAGPPILTEGHRTPGELSATN
jgi:hypothetical protein